MSIKLFIIVAGIAAPAAAQQAPSTIIADRDPVAAECNACRVAAVQQIIDKPKSGVRKYSDVIPRSAITQRGLWTTHRVGSALYFELPPSLLGKDVLALVRGNQLQRVTQWQQRGQQILLRSRGGGRGASSVGSSRESTGRGSIVASFPIVTTSPSGAFVIDVTRLFVGKPIPNWISPERLIEQTGVAIDSVEAFPENMIVKVAGRIPATEEYQARATWNFVRLPEHPMKPRFYDRRLGYRYDGWWSDRSNGIEEPLFDEHVPINRWRLEKKYPSQAMSEPIRPIVFYIDPETPPQWRQSVRQGIEAWQPAFEAAGFKNAIIAIEPPNDPSWSRNDVRNSVVLWSTNPAHGDNYDSEVHDPRTGEILQHNLGGNYEYIADTYSLRYFVRAGALDANAKTFPSSHDLQDAAVRDVVTHEVGHMIGLLDGSYGKFAYTVDQVRSPPWLEKMGHTPSVMNYTRMNYVPQPDDRVPAELLRQRVGPADFFSIGWGYAPISGTRLPQDEKKTLEAWARRTQAEPMLRYLPFGPVTGPDRVVEVVETTDPVATTKLGQNNLYRMMDRLAAMAAKDELDPNFGRIYNAVLSLWQEEIGHVVSLIGGYTTVRGAEPLLDERKPVPAGEQYRAMGFLRDSVFGTTPFHYYPDVTARVRDRICVRGYETYTDTAPGKILCVSSVQAKILQSLLDRKRVLRMAEMQNNDSQYSLSQMLREVSASLWSTKGQRADVGAVSKQDLQKQYVALLQELLVTADATPDPTAPSRVNDIVREAVQQELKRLHVDANAAVEQTNQQLGWKARSRQAPAQMDSRSPKSIRRPATTRASALNNSGA